MNKTYRVINNNSFDIGIRLDNPRREVVIKANTFVNLDENEILYTNSVSSLFRKGFIYVEEKEILDKMGFIEQNPNSISEEEIIEILKMPNNRMKSEISKITEDHAIDKVVKVIKKGEVDLSQSAIKLIDDALDIDIRLILSESEEETE